MSEQVLQNATSGNGSLTYNTRSYQTLVLIEVETMHPETAKAIKLFADAGGKLVFIGKAPHFSSGLTDYKEKSKEIENISHSILKHHPKTAGIVAAPGADLISWWRGIQQQFAITPYVNISAPVIHVNQLYYKSGDKDIFFFSNYSAAKSHSFTAGFNNKKTAWLWNAETGERMLYPSTANGELQINLGPSESKFIVFDTKKDGEAHTPVDTASLTATAITGPWQLTLRHLNDTTQKITLPELTDLKLRPDMQDFSGTIVYHKVINLSNAAGKTYLSLGHIYDVSEVEVNGRPLGAKWYGDHKYDISKAIQPGDNFIAITITTTAGAYTKSLKNSKAAQEWSDGDLYGPTGLSGGVYLFKG